MEMQMTLDEVVQTEKKAENRKDTTLSNGVLGCCGKYRECSQIGECLHKDEEYYLNCAYRRNLEKGKIFYSKKANRFNTERFADLLKFYNELNDKEKTIFFEVMFYFFAHKRAVCRCLSLYNQEIYDVLSRCNAFEIAPSELMIGYLFDVSIIDLKNSKEIYKTHTGNKFPAISVEKVKKELQRDYKISETKKIILSLESLVKIITKKYILFSYSDYSAELEELFRTLNKSSKIEFTHLIYLDLKKTDRNGDEEKNESLKLFKNALKTDI